MDQKQKDEYSKPIKFIWDEDERIWYSSAERVARLTVTDFVIFLFTWGNVRFDVAGLRQSYKNEKGSVWCAEAIFRAGINLSSFNFFFNSSILLMRSLRPPSVSNNFISYTTKKKSHD